MKKIIYINRLEMNYKYYSIKTTTTALVNGIVMLCTMLLMKSNYREYIKGTINRLEARLKGTPQPQKRTGAMTRKKILFMSFETWLYFLSTLKQLLSLSASALCLVIGLGYNFKKVVIK